MKSEYLLQTFFESQDENCRFTSERQHLAMQVLQIFEHPSQNNAKSFSPIYQVTENDVKSITTNFNKILCLVEEAKEALMTIGMVEDHGICTEEAGIPEETSQTNGIWDLIGIFVKASIGVALLDACWNPLLANAIGGLVIGGSAIAAAIAAWRLSSDDDHGNGCNDDDWNFRVAFVTYVQVIGGYILLLALNHPIAVLSGIITLIFFGLLAFFGGITLWETYFGNHLSQSVEEDDIFTIKENFFKELSLTSWFQTANQLSSAIEDATEHIVYVQSLNMAYALFSKVRETMKFEVWLNKYLNGTNSFCKLIERKYGSTLAPAVVAFVLIFDDRNRSLMDAVFKSRHFEKSTKPELDAKIFRSNFVSLVADLNKIQKKISKNFDEGLETSYLSTIIAPTVLDNKERNFNDSDFRMPLSPSMKDLIKSESDRNLIEFAKQDGLKTMSSSIDVQKNNNVEDQKYESKSPVKSEISDEKSKTHDTNESQSNDVRKYRKIQYSEFQIKNPLDNNRLKVSHKLQNDCSIPLVENEPDVNINCGYTNPIKVLKNGDKYKTSALKEKSNDHGSLPKTPLVEFSINSTSLEEFKAIKKLLRNPDKKILVDVESHKIPQVIGSDEKISILQELEKRVESLLDNGTMVKPWLVDLEKRFEKIFS